MSDRRNKEKPVWWVAISFSQQRTDWSHKKKHDLKCPAHWGHLTATSIKLAPSLTMSFEAKEGLQTGGHHCTIALCPGHPLICRPKKDAGQSVELVEHGGKPSGDIPEATAQEKAPSSETQEATGARLSGFRTWREVGTRAPGEVQEADTRLDLKGQEKFPNSPNRPEPPPEILSLLCVCNSPCGMTV